MSALDSRTAQATLSVLAARMEAATAEPGRNPLAGSGRKDVDVFTPLMQQRAAAGSVMAQRWLDAHSLQAQAVALFRSVNRVSSLSPAQMDEGLALLDRAHTTWDTMVWRYEDADMCHQVAVQRVRSDSSNRNALVQVARDGTDPREMAAMFVTLSKMFPKDADIIFSLGCLGGMGNPVEGVKLLRRSIELDGGRDPSRYFVLGGALRCTGKSKEAMAAFQKFLELNPLDHRHTPEAHYGLGYEYLMAGNLSKARECYEAGLNAEEPSIRLPSLEPVTDHYEPKAMLRHRFPTVRARPAPANPLHPLQGKLQGVGHEAASRMFDAHEAADSSKPPISAMLDHSGGAARAHWSSLLARTTDMTKNAADPYGDGDQSTVRSRGPADRNQVLYDVWASGADFNPYSLMLGASMSEFAKACYAGDIARVRAAIAVAKEKDGTECRAGDTATASAPSTSTSTSTSTSSSSTSSSSSSSHAASPGPAVSQLLERRASLLRLSPLLITIAGARAVGRNQHPGGDASGDWLGVARLLAASGARLTAKDVAGYGAIQHCTSAMATKQSLDIARFLLESPLDGGCGMSADACNRGGKTALHDAVMSMRIELVRVLVEFGGGADMHFKDPDGITPISLARVFPDAMAVFNQHNRRLALLHPTAVVVVHVAAGGGDLDPSLNGTEGRCVRYLPRLSRMLVEVKSQPGQQFHIPINQLKLCDERDTSLQFESPGASSDILCAGPGCDKYGSKQCVRCLSIRYCCRECQAKHWKTHKKDCKKMLAKIVKVPAAGSASATAAAASVSSSSSSCADDSEVAPSSLGVSVVPAGSVMSVPWGSTQEHVTDLGQAACAAAAVAANNARRGKKKGGRGNSAAQSAEEKGLVPVVDSNPGELLQRVIVKVQVSQGPLIGSGGADSERAHVLVYDKTRKWQRLISAEHPQYRAIVRSVRQGPLHLKAYLWATISRAGAVAFSLAEHAPPQDW